MVTRFRRSRLHVPGGILLLIATVSESQIQIGTVRGEVVDPQGRAVPGATVSLYATSSEPELSAVTDGEGKFALENVPLGLYRLRAEASGFRSHEEDVQLRSSLPLEKSVQLELAGPNEVVTVRAEAPRPDEGRIATSTRIGEDLVRRLPGADVSDLVATAAGWSTEDNGLLHSRGVDDGFLYVSNGVPRRDRMDDFFASSLETESFQSVEILDGHLPVEYGYASGGVIHVVTKSGLSRSWGGSFLARGGSEKSGGAAFTLGGSVSKDAGVFVSSSYRGSGKRYLDPVDPDNFNNRGQLLRLTSRVDWRASERDLFFFDFSAGGSGFRVTNSFEQELEGQRQRQELGDDHQSLVWQRSWSSRTVTSLVAYRHAFEAKLFGSERDTPISAEQDRHHVREGALVSVTHQLGDHLIKAGADYQRVVPRERFSFFVADEDADVSGNALLFERAAPFLFEERAERDQGSIYVQDTFSLLERLTVNAGVRFDSTSVLVRDQQLSPRIGASYFVPPLRATLRGSYNRLFMPPQVENLLLASSRQARELSPFTAESGKGGADVRPESQHAVAVGFAKAFGGWGLLDAAWWRREVRNYADPNVFFGTTILFPNSVAEGTASGVSARLELQIGRDLSGFVSYGNSLVVQRGPINGGLFLEEEVLEIGPGTEFIPDHDQRNVGAFGLTYRLRAHRAWVAVFGRHESGTPLEVDEDELDAIRLRRGAELVDFERMRVRPRTLLDVAAGFTVPTGGRLGIDVQVDVRNVTNVSFAYNFANPFSGTHFGHPRLVSARVRLSFPSGGK